MARYRCQVCEYIVNEEKTDVLWIDLSESWGCPVCGSPQNLFDKIDWLREVSGRRPIGVKFAAGNIEADLEMALYAGPDFITLDGRAGATGAAPKYVKAATSVPTIFAPCRARKFLDQSDAKAVSLIITGGIRVSADIAKALALGADAVAIGTAALKYPDTPQSSMCNRLRMEIHSGADTHKRIFP